MESKSNVADVRVKLIKKVHATTTEHQQTATDHLTICWRLLGNLNINLNTSKEEEEK